jgi:hypothetical protein
MSLGSGENPARIASALAASLLDTRGVFFKTRRRSSRPPMGTGGVPMFHETKVRVLIAALASTAFLAGGCRDQNVVTRKEAAPTPTAAIDRTQLAPDAVQNPFKEYAPGLLARTIYKAEQTDELEIDIWELLVGPGRKSEAAKLPGAAVAEVRSGTGLVTIGGKSQDLKSGAGFSISDGEAFQVENRSKEEELSLRVVLIRSH